MLLACLYNQSAAAHVYAETNGKIGALARVYTETNGTYGGIGQMLLYSRLSLLSIDMDCYRIGEQFPCVLYSFILQRKICFSN